MWVVAHLCWISRPASRIDSKHGRGGGVVWTTGTSPRRTSEARLASLMKRGGGEGGVNLLRRRGAWQETPRPTTPSGAGRLLLGGLRLGCLQLQFYCFGKGSVRCRLIRREPDEVVVARVARVAQAGCARSGPKSGLVRLKDPQTLQSLLESVEVL